MNMNSITDSESIKTVLRSHGLRATPQRMAVAELLLAKPSHVTAYDVYETIRQKLPAISPNTIYLTLAHFENRGLLRRFRIHGKSVFDSNTTRHDHGYCTVCGKIADLFSPPAAGHSPEEMSDWEVLSESRVWYGKCPNCA